MRTAAIILAGGAGTRLHRSENKVYLPIGDRPLLAWSLATFERSPLIDDIVLVIRPIDREVAGRVLHETEVAKLRTTAYGGATRHASELAGLEQIADDIESGRIGLVVIHDAARPFVSFALLRRVVETARLAGGAVPALPVRENLVRNVGNDLVQVSAHNLRRVQTPQAFRAPELLAAYRRAHAESFSGVDTSESVARFSDITVQTVDGDPRNVKVTFVEDLFVAEQLAAHWTDLHDS